MKNKKLNTILLISLISLPVLTLAAKPVIPGSTLPTPVTDMQQIINLIQSAVNWIFAILMIVAVIYILLAAFAYLGSAGDPEKVKTAQNRLIYAAVAIGVGLIAQGVQFIVENFITTGR